MDFVPLLEKLAVSSQRAGPHDTGTAAAPPLPVPLEWRGPYKTPVRSPVPVQGTGRRAAYLLTKKKGWEKPRDEAKEVKILQSPTPDTNTVP